jgi:hypothetical protein
MRVLDVREVRTDGPRHGETERPARSIRNRGVHVEPARADGIGDPDVDCALGDAVAVGRLLVTGLAGPAAARLGDLGVDVGEGERVRGDRRRLARPRRVAVDA